jgi:subtilisin
MTVLVMVLAAFAAVPGSAGDPKIEVVVLFNDSVDEQLIKDNNGKVDKKYSQIPAAVTKLTAKDIKALQKSGKVKAVEENHIYSIAKKPSDKPGKPGGDDPPAPPPQVMPWGIDRIDAEWVWDDANKPATGDGVTVAVIDTGIDKDHSDLKDNIVGGYNLVVQKGRLNTNAWDDDNGHGTHVAGTIAAVDNNLGVVGVAPDAGLYGIKVLNKRGSGYMTDVIDGILWAATVNVGSGGSPDYIDVISMSLSGPKSSSLASAITYASGQGIVIVAASGNDYASSVSYPSAYPEVISVGATDSSDRVASFSNYGPKLDFVAPGVSVLSTYKNDGYATGSGTSMATPHVSGIVALLLEAGVTPANVYDALKNSVDPLSAYDSKDGHGLVDAEEAVTGSEADGDD